LVKVNYKEEITKLIELQSLDSQLYKLNREKENQPKIINDLQQVFEDKKQQLKTWEEKLKSIQLKRKEKEIDLGTHEEQIKKLQGQLYALKTNKEYTAMLNEINGKKMNQSLLEEEILNFMEEQDKAKKELEQQKINVAEEEKKFNQEKQKIQNHLKEIEAQSADLQSKRAVIIKTIDSKILPKYERILKGREGLAIIDVDENDFSCKGCYMKATPQVVNEIKMNKGLVFCEVCSRILYVKEDEKQ